VALIAGLPSSRPPFTFPFFREMGTIRPVSKCRGYGTCFITGAYGFSAGNGKLFDILVIGYFRNVICRCSASPRVRQRRGRLSPPSVAPAGSRPEAARAFNPSWDSPATSGHNFSHPLFPITRPRIGGFEPCSPRLAGGCVTLPAGLDLAGDEDCERISRPLRATERFDATKNGERREIRAVKKRTRPVWPSP
jgi:hypothetical protein